MLRSQAPDLTRDLDFGSSIEEDKRSRITVQSHTASESRARQAQRSEEENTGRILALGRTSGLDRLPMVRPLTTERKTLHLSVV